MLAGPATLGKNGKQPVASSPRTTPDQHEEPAGAFGELRVLLTCPECGADGWVAWRRLSRALICRQCQCQFALGRDGKLRARSEAPPVHYACPRCGQSGAIPAALVVRRAECGSCKLPLVRGPDQKLHGLDEVTQLQRAANRAARQPEAKQPAWIRVFQTPSGLPHKPRLALAGVLLFGLLGLAVWRLALRPASPESVAADFTSTCLTGQWTDTEAFLEDDLLQLSQFHRWRVRHFTSILDKYRPAGDSVEVQVETLDASPGRRKFRILLRSPFLGTRSHLQHWRERDERWYFDAHATVGGQ